MESEGRVAALIKRECDEIQGYLLSRPRDAKNMEALLRKGCLLSGEILHDAAAQRTLLLVDDEEYILTALKRLLRRESYRVLTAPSGHEGLELLAKNQVYVIISDQRMPGMMGVEFLRRAKDTYPDTVRIVLSGYTELQSDHRRHQRRRHLQGSDQALGR